MQPSMASVTCQSAAALLICLVVSCSACFVRNCPPGGKRSLQPFTHPQRECLRCGPDSLGQCVGPNICCGRATGCYINTPETQACLKENDILSPCRVEGELCGSLGEGRCVAEGVCCNDERCELDDACARDNSPSDLTSNIAQKRLVNRLSPEVVKFLRKLFDHKSYQKRK